jgi:hypothetical protein
MPTTLATSQSGAVDSAATVDDRNIVVARSNAIDGAVELQPQTDRRE